MPETNRQGEQVPPPKNGKQTDQEDTQKNQESDFEGRINQLVEKGRRRGKLFSVLGILAALVLGAAFMAGFNYFSQDLDRLTADVDKASRENLSRSWRNAAQGLAIPDKWRACATDAECVKTSSGCCSCMSGGEQDAIQESHLIDWKEVLSRNCGNRVCGQTVNCQEGEAICQKGQCTFASRSGQHGCVKEGNAFPAARRETGTSSPPAECCFGLRAVPVYSLSAGKCSSTTSKTVCVDCPNGVCGQGEDFCNCPDDCRRNPAVKAGYAGWEDHLCTGLPLRFKYPADWRLDDQGDRVNLFASGSSATISVATSGLALPDTGELDRQQKYTVKATTGVFTGAVYSGQGRVLHKLTEKRNRVKLWTEYDKELSASSTFSRLVRSVVMLKEPECANGRCEGEVDTDGDGLSDRQEFEYGTDPDIKDTDNDGYTDKQEIDTGYNPLGLGRL